MKTLTLAALLLTACYPETEIVATWDAGPAPKTKADAGSQGSFFGYDVWFNERTCNAVVSSHGNVIACFRRSDCVPVPYAYDVGCPLENQP